MAIQKETYPWVECKEETCKRRHIEHKGLRQHQEKAK